MELLLDRIRSAIAQHREAPAFITDAGQTTFGEMRALTGAAIRMLDERGIRAGSTVSLTMSQSPLHVMLFLALARMGVASVPVPPVAREADRVAAYRRFGVEASISDRADAAAPGVPLLLVQGIAARGDEDDFDTWPFVPQPRTLLRIALTSGTVERKGIDQDHVAFAMRLTRRHYGAEPVPRVLPPNLHVTAALQAALHALCHGGAVVFPRAYDAPRPSSRRCAARA